MGEPSVYWQLRASLADLDKHTADLVDRGGFTNIAKTRPYVVDPYPLSDGQQHPMLYERAYWLAWYLNNHAMLYLNITDPYTNRSRISSSLGQRFSVNSTFTRYNHYIHDFYNLERGSTFENLIVDAPFSLDWNSSTHAYSNLANPLIPNPHNITADNISYAVPWFVGYGSADTVNISTIAVELGYVIGPSVMSNQVDPDNVTSVATYERPLYICASATKTSIKTVRFRYNSTTIHNLRNLEIVNIKDKTYEREDHKPVWGFEMPWLNSSATWETSNINPLWGIVDEPLPKNRNVSTIRSEHFYIPAGAAAVSANGYNVYDEHYHDFVAGTAGPLDNWGQTFGDSTTDYQNDNVQLIFFRELTRNSTGVQKLAQLIWTDIATNYMVGTRGIHTPRYKPMLQTSLSQKRDSNTTSMSLPIPDTSGLATGHYPVYMLERGIRYRWIYGIPAIVSLATVVLSMFMALVSIMCGNASVRRLRNLMYNISAGRVFASFVHPELEEEKTADTKRWIKLVGHKPIQIEGQSSSRAPSTWTESKAPHVYVRVTQRDDIDSIALAHR